MILWLFFGSSGFISRLIAMDYSYQGRSYVVGPANGTTNMNTMDYAYMGKPFVGYIK